MHKHVQGRTPFLPPLASSRVWFFKFLLIIFKTLFGSTPKTLFFSKNIMTSLRLSHVNTQRSFLSGICPSRELHGPTVKVTAPPIKKTEVRNSQGLSFEVRKIPFNVVWILTVKKVSALVHVYALIWYIYVDIR